jgi:hypothetical protein
MGDRCRTMEYTVRVAKFNRPRRDDDIGYIVDTIIVLIATQIDVVFGVRRQVAALQRLPLFQVK